MAHLEYKRIVPGADTAVLLIHGICGSPNHFRDLIPLEQQVPENWSVHNLLLDGHGCKVEDFAGTSMAKWKTQVWAAFEELCSAHDRVMIVAHSMGTLFAIQLAAEHPEKIDSLLLLSVPLRPCVRLRMMRDCLLLVFGGLPADHVLCKASGVTVTWKIWKYLLWIPRFWELFKEIRITEQSMAALKASCIAYQSKKDELVSNLTGGVLERSGVMEVCYLPRSTHYFYHGQDQTVILDDFKKRINKKTHD